jgi:cobalt-zinc-cadmium efflux system outer membrane protein
MLSQILKGWKDIFCRINFFSKYLFAGYFLVFSAGVLAEGTFLTLEQAQTIAITHNKELQTARYNIELAKMRLIQAGQYANPRLELENIRDRFFSNDGEYTTRIGISQEFPIAGRIGRQKDVARIDIALAELEINDAERKLEGEVAALFYKVLVGELRLKRLGQLIEVNHHLALVAQSRLKAAEVSEVDSNTARIEWQRLLQQKGSLQNTQGAQRIQWNNFLGQQISNTYSLQNDIPATIQFPPLESLQAQALQLRPDLQAVKLEAERAQAGLNLAHSQRWEDWTVVVGVEQNKLVITGVGPQNPSRSLGIKLSVPLPLFNTNRGAILAASTAGLQARQKSTALTLNIQSEVASNYMQIARLREQLAQYQSDLLPLSMRNVRLAQEAYGHGQISLFDVVQTQRQESDLYNTYLDTLDNYLQTQVKISMAVGNYRLDKIVQDNIKR